MHLHQQLRANPCQITLHERPGIRPYLLKTFQSTGQEDSRVIKIKPKIVQHHNNPTISKRCFVKLFKVYQRVCSPDRPKDAFYLQPLDKPTPTCWYSCKPIGYHKLEWTVALLCKTARIPGFRTNHSLWATAATRLYNAGLDEQQVIEQTGHCSLDGVSGYEHTSVHQKEVLSDILNGQTKQLPSGGSLEVTCLPVSEPTSSSGPVINNTSASQSLDMTFTYPSMFTFQSCSVTINFNKN